MTDKRSEVWVQSLPIVPSIDDLENGKIYFTNSIGEHYYMVKIMFKTGKGKKLLKMETPYVLTKNGPITFGKYTECCGEYLGPIKLVIEV